jgi:hypothetical protein
VHSDDTLEAVLTQRRRKAAGDKRGYKPQHSKRLRLTPVNSINLFHTFFRPRDLMLPNHPRFTRGAQEFIPGPRITRRLLPESRRDGLFLVIQCTGSQAPLGATRLRNPGPSSGGSEFCS